MGVLLATPRIASNDPDHVGSSSMPRVSLVCPVYELRLMILVSFDILLNFVIFGPWRGEMVLSPLRDLVEDFGLVIRVDDPNY